MFNLDRAELDARFVVPWLQGSMIDQDDRRWAPDKTKLKIMAGAAIQPGELGLGRGWGAVTKDSQDVTEAVIAEARQGASPRPEVQALKEQIIGRAAEPVDLRAVMALPAAAVPGRRVSEQLATAEEAVWELLHQGRLAMLAGGAEVPPERWQETVLSFASWAPADGADPVHVQARVATGNGRG